MAKLKYLFKGPEVQLFRLRIYATSGQSVKRIEALHPLQKLLQHVATIIRNLQQPNLAKKRLHLPAFDTHFPTPIFVC